MSGPGDDYIGRADTAQVPKDALRDGSATRQTPDDSTLLLPTPATTGVVAQAGPGPLASSNDNDVPRLLPGESLAGRFTILRFIAQGGMGAVYEASDVMLRSGVALKVIRGRIATDATAMERFRREVLLARRVGHPNV